VRILQLESDPHSVTHHGSERLTVSRLVAISGGGQAVCLRLGPGGVVGRHDAAGGQLLAVVEGSARVSGAEREEVELGRGGAVLWEPGEPHETRTDSGLLALVVEAESIEPFAR
jgi:quercetin dioxygenase-like cupin family protein